MKISDSPREAAVHLLGKGGILAAGTKPRFHVSYRRLVIISRQRPGEGGGGIAVHQHQIRPFRRQHAIEPRQGSPSDVEERLPDRHDVEIMIGTNVKKTKHLIEHFPVLRRYGHHCGNLFRVLSKFEDHRRHFYSFRPRPEHGHDLDLPFRLHAAKPSVISAYARYCSNERFPGVWRRTAQRRQRRRE